ncbi:MAG: transglycosylase SLT domain-containing protein [Rhodospirillaceae bacterium]|nr:transglycosylase SLT domain-containing protein [Rhodospirillaceae bacterium]
MRGVLSLKLSAQGLGTALAALGTLVTAAFTAPEAAAQASDNRDCMRNVQIYERSQRIPQGLLTAVAFTESGREIDGDRVPWPWTINVGGNGRYFDTKEQAVAAVRKLLDEGQRSIDVGCMQINLRYHPTAFRDIEQAFDPAANVAYGAQYLKQLYGLQGSWPKAVERYHSSDDARRAEYRERVLAFWNTDARTMILSQVIAENTDTPYHRALRDFAAGQYTEALDKYQGIVDKVPSDRLALLGIAMSYDKLGRMREAQQAYTRLLIVEPDNEAALARVIQMSANLPATDAQIQLENLVQKGVKRPEVYAALAEMRSSSGDDQSAFEYLKSAIQMSPMIAMYHLNIGILADRLKRKEDAVAGYSEFLRIFELNPVITDTPVDGIRERVKYLRNTM